ncbi:3-deoxy-7-phosphoheptulonate synthase [Kitasatospora mediocidica]|uniref:3-deoxy-7-phosphoheptulonate synthase n=1 Tax=Kitasatospora mediocidica TaxID=58352 RepID=UPI00068D3247|nr:3-deoxy-7-phosphoheptulonate synthase class II [Kitasatospora mediocidica]
MRYSPRRPAGGRAPDRTGRPVERLLAERLAAALARPAAQQPDWPDRAVVRAVVDRLRTATPVVAPAETAQLSERLAAVARGEAFLLQGGDCAETFADHTAAHLRANLGLLKRMALVFTHATGLPVVPLARAAGQYAKPRSQQVDAQGLPVYRGDIVNGVEPTSAARTPDPARMLRAQANAVETMALARRLCRGELGDPHALHAENLRFVRDSPAGGRYAPAVEEIGRSLRLLAGLGASGRTARQSEIYVSHEALLLDYESALLRVDESGPEPLLSSGLAHFLWIGERTRAPQDAHIAFAELLANPIGLKIGPGTTPEQAVEYVHRLDPHGTPGRLTLISRMGHDRVRDVLPPIVEKVTASGHQVVWQCDPMHGNSRTTESGYKTRAFDHVLEEITGFLDVHRRLGTHPGGLHLEATGEDVTECLGGARGIAEHDLPARYLTACDPRLNAEQSMELAFTVAELFARRTPPRPERPR